MGEPLAAVKIVCLSAFKLNEDFGGITEISAPVSIRNVSLVFLHLINRRRVEETPGSAVWISGFISFFELRV